MTSVFSCGMQMDDRKIVSDEEVTGLKVRVAVRRTQSPFAHLGDVHMLPRASAYYVTYPSVILLNS